MLILYLLLGIAWIYLLFRVGKGKKSLTFYIMLFAPAIITITAYTLITKSIPFGILSTLNGWAYLILIAFALERIAWAVTLKESAGEELAAWFVVIYLLPIGWFLYRITKKKKYRDTSDNWLWISSGMLSIIIILISYAVLI